MATLKLAGPIGNAATAYSHQMPSITMMDMNWFSLSNLVFQIKSNSAKINSSIAMVRQVFSENRFWASPGGALGLCRRSVGGGDLLVDHTMVGVRIYFRAMWMYSKRHQQLECSRFNVFFNCPDYMGIIKYYKSTTKTWNTWTIKPLSMARSSSNVTRAGNGGYGSCHWVLENRSRLAWYLRLIKDVISIAQQGAA